MLTLRDYQRSALDAAYRAWSAGAGDILITAPCGAGKSLLIAALCQEALTSWPETRILVLAHVKELLRQDGNELLKLWPEALIGYYSAGLNRKDKQASITFAGIQSIWSKVTDFEPWDLILIDEAHLLPRSIDTRYGACIASLKLMNPSAKILGLTATPYRLDSGRLDEGEGALFERVVYDIKMQTLVDAGHLVELTAKGGRAKADLSGVHRRGGDFIPGEVEQAFDKNNLVEGACDEIVIRGADRKAWLIFCSGIAHMEHVRDALRARQTNAEMVSGETPSAERASLYERFADGQIKALCNVDLLTVGSNLPIADMLVLLRATESTGLYVQVLGRGARYHPGKTDCLVLDMGGNVMRHGPVDAVNPKKKAGDGTGTAPCKECPVCQSIVHASAIECRDCGFVFPAREVRHEVRPYEGAVLKAQQKTTWIPVDEVRYARHQKAGKPDSVRISYHCGLISVDEWWCPEHGGYATAKTAQQLLQAGMRPPLPRTTTELLARTDELIWPTEVTVRSEGKYLRLDRMRYER